MAISVNTAWEVRPNNGLDTNGGGFVQGATGTDWSQQNSPQYAVTDGVTAGTTTIISATANFGTDVVGNIMYVQGGTGSVTAGWYQITVRTNSTTVTVDRSTGLTAGTGVTLRIGGALLTISKALAVNTNSNIIFVKAEVTIVRTASLSLNNSLVPATNLPPNQLIGYTTTRGDNGQVTIQESTNASIQAIDGSGANGWVIRNFSVDCNNLSDSRGIRVAALSLVQNCKVTNYKALGIYSGGRNTIMQNEVSNGTGATAGIWLAGANSTALFNYVHDSSNPGIQSDSAQAVICHNICETLTGGNSWGIIALSDSSFVMNNVCYACGADGIVINGTGVSGQVGIFLNNILVSNTTFGLRATTIGSGRFPNYDGNAYYNNTSGTRSNLDDVGGTNPINAANPYTNVHDVILTGDPFTNAAGGDFTLNTTAGAGAACRAAGLPSTIAGATGTGYPDLGVFQHPDPAATPGKVMVLSGMLGGFRG